MEKIMVDLYIRERLDTNVEIEWGKWVFILKLDYWRIHFRYNACRAVGILRVHYKLVEKVNMPFKNIWIKKIGFQCRE